MLSGLGGVARGVNTRIDGHCCAVAGDEEFVAVGLSGLATVQRD